LDDQGFIDPFRGHTQFFRRLLAVGFMGRIMAVLVDFVGDFRFFRGVDSWSHGFVKKRTRVLQEDLLECMIQDTKVISIINHAMKQTGGKAK
jgi:hypothetical protein